MKNRPKTHKALNPNGFTRAFLFTSLLISSLSFSSKAFASPEIDRQYSLDSVGVLRPWDNVDGLFSDYLRDAYKDYFASQTRFKLQDIGKSDPVLLKSKLPYSKIIEDQDILQQLARSARVESLIRTKVYKEGRKYRVTLDLIHSARMDVLGSDEFAIQDPEPGQALEPSDLKSSLHRSVDRLFSKLPFVGQITGRDRDWVTVSVTRSVQIRKGDQLVVTTLEDVKRHPLLKQIVDWRQAETGRVEVDEIDRGIAFAKILEEQPGRQIAPYQKIFKVLPSPDLPISVEKNNAVDDEIEKKRLEPPKTGWVDGGLWLGGFSRENSSLNSTSGRTGGGFLYGAKAGGQLWITRNVFSDLQFAYGLMQYTQQDIQTSQNTSGGNGSASASKILFDLGYSYLVTGDFWGPKASIRLGYKRTSYSLPESNSELIGPIAFGSFFLGLGGDLPIYDYWGAQLLIDIGLFRNVSQTGYSAGTTISDSDISFYIGAYYHFAPRIMLKMGLQFDSSGADFDSNRSISHRIISFVPSIQYYF